MRSRIEVGGSVISAQTTLSEARQSLAISAAVSKAAVFIMPGDGDGFLQKVLPAGGLHAEFDPGIAWSNSGGLTLRGAAGLDATIPVGLSLGGIALTTLTLGIRAIDGQLGAEVSASLSAVIGPVHASLDRIGLNAALTFPDGGGNLGVADLSIGFQPPRGAGIAIDTGGILTGGGFLFHDPVQQLYAGVLQLSLHERLTLTAFGLIATKMPDGSRGYSMIVFITAEGFQPIQLGMGFTLNGIGGMVAIHRTFDEDVLRAGLKNDTLGTLLFPRDPVGNAPALIATLAAAFPAKQGSYLLGLLVRIGWSTPTLVLLDLALILEFGARTRLLVLGRISALLPSPDNDLVRLILDSMGVLDFDQGTASIDAVLVDSRLAHKFALTGAMALRARWSSGPGSGFILAVGGFNPHFAPPEGLPALQRVGIALSSGDNPRLTCDAYFAHHLQHRAVRRARAALRGRLRLQRRRRHRLRRADPDRAAALHRRLQRQGPAQARLEQPVHGQRRRRARRATTAARQRQGLVLDLLVRLHGALRQDAGRRRSTAAAAGHRRAGATQASAGQPAELDRATRAGPHPGRGTPSAAAEQQPTRARPARALARQAAGRAAEHRARHRDLRRRAGQRGPALPAQGEP